MVSVMVARLVYCEVLAKVCLVCYLDKMDIHFKFLHFIFGLYVHNNTKPYDVRCITIGQTVRWTRMINPPDVDS
jgi:hypothetical protein